MGLGLPTDIKQFLNIKLKRLKGLLANTVNYRTILPLLESDDIFDYLYSLNLRFALNSSLTPLRIIQVQIQNLPRIWPLLAVSITTLQGQATTVSHQDGGLLPGRLLFCPCLPFGLPWSIPLQNKSNYDTSTPKGFLFHRVNRVLYTGYGVPPAFASWLLSPLLTLSLTHHARR